MKHRALESRKSRERRLRFFSKKNVNLEKRLEEEIINHSIAFIPCSISKVTDIISPLSVKDHESLNPDFLGYIQKYAENIPAEYPIVIELCGHQFTKKEREMIARTIRSEFDFNLGQVQADIRRNRKMFALMFLGMFFSLVLLKVTSEFDDSFFELPYVIFWFFADAVLTYAFLERRASHKNRLLAARLASASVKFEKKYEENLTEKEADAIIQEVFAEQNR